MTHTEPRELDMIVTLESAAYMASVALALKNGQRPRQLLTECPECGLVPGFMNNDNHAVIEAPDHPHMYYVVIACEGYWVVDPTSVGVDSPNWMPIDDRDDDDEDEAEAWLDDDHDEFPITTDVTDAMNRAEGVDTRHDLG